MVTVNIQDKHRFLTFENVRISKNIPLNSVFPNSKNLETIIYENIYNRYTFIIKDVCALANSNGGVIYVGVNSMYRCIGGSSKTADDWLENILKLSRILYNTIHTFEMSRIKYYIKNYIVEINGVESYLTEIQVPKADEQCLVNSYGNISYYIRKENSTVSIPIDEDVIQRILMDENHVDQKYDIGDLYEEEEGEKMEFKSSLKFLKSNDGIGKYYSSFGNKKGGKIAIGIGDDRKITGVLIKDPQEWDRIKQSVIINRNHIKPAEFLNNIRIWKIPLRRKLHFIVIVDIPPNTANEPILVKDAEGIWNQWTRAISCSIKVEKQFLYSKNDMSELKKKYINSETQLQKMRKEIEQTNLKDESKYKWMTILGFTAILILGIKFYK